MCNDVLSQVFNCGHSRAGGNPVGRTHIDREMRLTINNSRAFAWISAGAGKTALGAKLIRNISHSRKNGYPLF